MTKFQKDDFLKNLRDYGALRDTVFYAGDEEEPPIASDSVQYKVLDRQAPDYADDSVLDKLHPQLAESIGAKVSKLYSHQSEAINRSLAGEDVILEAPTASGKTLAFAIPMFNCLIKESRSHALLLYPMKALSRDQRAQFMKIAPHHRRTESWFYDGDTSPGDRESMRQHPDQIPCIITTPEMLHLTFLAHNHIWEKFLKNLRFLVIDEVHEYRGYFGSNIALLLRRFLHHLESLGVKPQIFMASATCANPEEHAKNLTGRKFSLVSAKQRMRPSRHFFFIDPVTIPAHNFYNIFRMRVVNAARACMAMGLSVLIFCPTIKFLNECLRDTRRKFDEENLDKDHLASFYAGMNDDAKESVREGLRDGKIRVVFSTNALELGVDIVGLDGVILAGFPNNVMSAWQRIGRAGRNWKSDAFVLFYASNNVADKFYARNLNMFLNKDFDALTANPANDELMEKHVICFPYEAGGKLHNFSREILGEQFYHKAESVTGDATPVAGSWRPHRNVPIRGVGGNTYKLELNGKEVGSISEEHKFRDAYIGAIYTFEGNKYKVEGHSENAVTLRPCSKPIRTEPKMFSVLSPQDIFDGFGWHDALISVSILYGKIQSQRHYRGYGLYKDDSVHEKVLISDHPGEGIRSITTHAVWWHIEESASSPSAMRALAEMVRIGALFNIPCDRHDVNTFSQKGSEIYLYESYPGGIGIVKVAFTEAVWRNLMKAGAKIARKCSCSNGCPNCIDPRHSHSEDVTDKIAGIKLADMILQVTDSPFDKRFKNGAWHKV